VAVDMLRLEDEPDKEIHTEIRTVWGAGNPGSDSREMLLDPLLARGQHIAIFGPAKIGKSRLAQEAAGCLATGRDFLGRPTIRTRVLYLDKENDPKYEVEDRLVRMGFDLDDLDYLVHVSYPTMGPIDTERGAENLLDILARYQSEVVIFDTVSRFVEGEENSNTTYNKAYEHTGIALRQNGIAMIRIDHSGKDEGKGARGASAKAADVDVSWRMSKKRGQEISVRREGGRSLALPGDDAFVIAAVDEPHLHHRIVEGGRVRSAKEKALEFADLLDSQGCVESLSIRDTGRTLRNLDFSVGNDVVSEVVRLRKHRGASVPVAAEDSTDYEGLGDEYCDQWPTPSCEMPPPDEGYPKAHLDWNPDGQNDVPESNADHSWSFMSPSQLGSRPEQCARPAKRPGQSNILRPGSQTGSCR
jgi:hypothetical protein